VKVSKENEQGVEYFKSENCSWISASMVRLVTVYDSMGCWGAKLSTARGRSGFELLSTDDHLNVFAFAWIIFDEGVGRRCRRHDCTGKSDTMLHDRVHCLPSFSKSMDDPGLGLDFSDIQI